MALVFYVIDENGEYSSSDGEIIYKKLEGNEVYSYLQTEKSKNKRFYVEDDIGIEVIKEKEDVVRSYERRKQYIGEIYEKNPYEIISFFAEVPELDIDGEDVAEDKETDVFKQALYNLVVEDLYESIDKLTDKEKYIIKCIYLTYPPKKQEDLAAELGVSQQVISKNLVSAKKKLKKFLKKWL